MRIFSLNQYKTLGIIDAILENPKKKFPYFVALTPHKDNDQYFERFYLQYLAYIFFSKLHVLSKLLY